MKPGYCETEAEYRISIKLLKEFIISPGAVAAVNGKEGILHHILHYLDKYVTPYKDLFLHCLRKDLRFFDISHNSSHEGTNNGMKSCSVAPVLPVLSMTTSARRMTMQSGMTTHRVNEQCSRTFNKKKLWSHLPTSNYLVMTAESILSKQSQRYTSYSVVRIGAASFEVSFNYGRDKVADDHEDDHDGDGMLMPYQPITATTADEQDSKEDNEENEETMEDQEKNVPFKWHPIPAFRRERIVSFDTNTSTVKCSCCQFERIGIPCVHVQVVVKAVDPEWNGFTHHQVAVRWWSVYAFKGYPYRASDACPVSRALGHLSENDIDAPAFGHDLVARIKASGEPICEPSPSIPDYQRVLNYNTEDLRPLFALEKDDNSILGGQWEDGDGWDMVAYSQTTYDPQREIQDNEGGGGGTTTPCNLFDRLEIQAHDGDEGYGEAERTVRSILAVYASLGQDGRIMVKEGLDNLLVHGRAELAKQNQSKELVSGGMRGIVEETNRKRKRVLITHHPYYQG